MKQLAIALCSLLTLSAAAHADTNELRIAKQPGLSYLPAVIAEKLQLVEKHARAAGLSDFKTTWTRLTNGGASNDALLSGNVDMVISGGPNMLILWAKTSGRVKGVVATGALPMLLVTNNPNVKTIADFTDQDRIAVPTIRVGTQPAVLGIAVEKQFGLGAVERYNSLTAHFSQPPYQNQELKIPGVHTVLNSFDVVGGGMTNGCFYSTTDFRAKNPIVVKALVDAIKEAVELVKTDKKRAAEIYLEVNKESISPEELTEILNQPNMIYSAAPLGLLQAAQFFSRAGYIKQKPTDWKEFFFPEVHDLNGS
jgi:NitT/TauT family transport system substrate-binding protein